MIELKNLTKIYNTQGGQAVGLNNVNISFNKGEFVAIVGPSGSGKTTLLNVISATDTYEEGELNLLGQETSSFRKEDFENFRRNNVAFIFQNYQLIDSFTCVENVMIELMFKGKDRTSAKEEAISILEKVGLSHRLQNRCSKLSGGEKQRVVIARALASNSPIIACDEPTGNLDVQNSIEIINLLKSISHDKLVLFVTHEPELVEEVATRVVTIKDGAVFSDISKQEVEAQESNLNLEKKSASISTCLYLAFKTLIAVPKKTILLFILMLAATFFTFQLIASMFNLPTFITEDMFLTESYYQTNIEDRIIVYNDGSNYQVDGYSYKMENDYLLDQQIGYSDFDYTVSQLFINVNNPVLSFGRMPQNEWEVVLTVNSMEAMYLTQYEFNKGMTINLTPFHEVNTYYDVVGIAFTDEMVALVNFYENEIPSIIEEKYSLDAMGNDINAYVNDVQYKVILMSNIDEISIPFGVDIEDVKLYLGDMNIDISQYDYYNDSEGSKPYIFIPESMITDFVSENVYRTTYIFDSNYKLTTAIKNASGKGLTVVYPDYFNSGIDYIQYFNSFMKAINFSSTLFQVLIAYLVIGFIIYVVQKSQLKDFTIMRVIGLNKNNLFFVMFLRFLAIMYIAYFVILGLLSAIYYSPLGSYIFIKLILDTVYGTTSNFITFIFLSAVALFFAKFCHKKMFRYSASANLRGGDLL